VNEQPVKSKRKIKVEAGAPVIVRVSQAGAQTNTILARLKPNETLTQEIKLVRSRNAKPTIFLESTQGMMQFTRRGASGESESLSTKGLTMLTVDQPGALLLTGELEGFKSEVWRLNPSLHQSYTVRFNPEKEGKGRLRIVGPSVFKVSVDGASFGSLPFDQDQLATGPHVMELSNDKENISLRMTPEVYEGRWVRWELKRSKGGWRLVQYGVSTK
jgi:hypothetical protein